MNFTWKKFLSICCIIALVWTSMPMQAFVFAADGTTVKQEEQTKVKNHDSEQIGELKETIWFTFDPYDFSTRYDVTSFFAYRDLYQGSFGSELSDIQKEYYDLLVSTYIDEQTGLSMSTNSPLLIELDDTKTYPMENSNTFYSEGIARKEEIVLDISYAFFAFTHDYPQAFWARNLGCGISYYRWIENGNYVGQFCEVEVNLDESYTGAADLLELYNAGVNDAVENIKILRGEVVNSYHTVKAIHDYICKKVTYDRTAASSSSDAYMYAHSSGPVFTKGNPTVVCEGYGMAFKVLCDAFDIPCAMISGEGNGGPHLWNYVQIDGIWYGVDVTWDDQEYGIIYDYFLAGAEKMNDEHTPKNNSFDTEGILSFAYPILNEDPYEYNPKDDYDMSGVTFTDEIVTYDGMEHGISITGTLPAGVTVSYANNSQIDAGTYIVTASFSGDSENYNPIPDMTATLTIEPKSIASATVSGLQNYTYDGSAKMPSITVKDGNKTLTKGADYNVSYQNNINAGTAKVVVKGINNYKDTLTKEFTINKASYDLSGVTFASQTYTYSGTSKSLKVSGTLPTGVKVSYENNDKVSVGTYTVKAVFTGDSVNYYPIQDMTATLTINPKSLTADMISGITDQNYTGNAVSQNIVVKDGSSILKEGQDYQVSYVNNVECGTATITVSGINNYTGTINKNFTIQPCNFETAVVEFEEEHTYTGQEIHPEAKVTYQNKVLIEGKDYEVGYQNCVNAGEGVIIIEGRGSYDGTIRKTFVIHKAAYNLSDISFNEQIFVYDGTEKFMSIEGELPAGVTVSYTNNGQINAGKYVVTAHFSGDAANYQNISDKTAILIIEQRSIETATISVLQDCTFDGTEKKPEVTVKDGAKTLTKDKDYAVSYENNTNAGTATVIVKGIGNYKNSVTGTFYINPKAMTEDMISGITNKYYTGNPVYQNVVVKDGSIILKEGQDYQVSYTDNIECGTASIKVSGINNYTGTVTENFIIHPYNFEDAVVEFEAEHTYTGQEIHPEVKVTYQDKVLTEGEDYEVSYLNCVYAGEGTIVIEGRGSYFGTITKTFIINKADYDMSGVTFAGKTYTYNGKSKSLTISGTLPEGVTVSYKNNGKTSAGTYTVTAVFAGDTANYNPIASKTATLKINPVSITEKTVALSATSYTYNGKAKKPAVTISGLKNGTDYTVTYSSNVAVGTAKVTIKGKGNYTGTLTKTFTIKKPAITPTNVKASLYEKYNTVRVSWSKNSSATGYKVYYKKSTATKWTSVKTTKTYYVKTKLADGVKHQFKVVPMVNSVESSKSKTVTATTLKKMKAPTVKKYSSTKVSVSWTKINGAAGYQIKQFKSSKTTSKGESYKATGKSKVMKAVKKKKYYYRVRPYYKTSAGKYIYGPWSAYKTYTLK